MKLENFLIGIGLFSLFVVVFVGAAANMVNDYGDMGISVTFDNTSMAVYDKASEIDAQAQAMQANLKDIPSGPISAIGAFIAAAWATIIGTLSGVGLIQSILSAVGESFHLPAAVTGFIISALIITLVLLIAKMVFNLGDSS